MDHTTVIVVENKYGGIITQVAKGYNMPRFQSPLSRLLRERGD
jgi:hypothetical protein